MKSKRTRHDTSSDGSEESDASVESISSSDSESDVSSTLQRRNKKKRKRADSSESESDSEGVHKRSKKRKHKKKKKRHNKKKRHVDSHEDSVSEENVSSESDADASHKKKKKRKQKHKAIKRCVTPASGREYLEDEHRTQRLQSIVKERQVTSDEEKQPTTTYYQKEYRRSSSVEEYDVHREREVQRFYRGSSKERDRNAYQPQYSYGRDHNNRYENHSQQRGDRNRERYQQHEHNEGTHHYDPRRQREYVDYNNRNLHYEDRRVFDRGDFQQRSRNDDSWRRDHQGEGKYRGHHQYGEEGARRQDNDEARGSRDYRDRRVPPQHGRRYQEKEYTVKRDGYEERMSNDRARDMRRDRPEREDKPLIRDQRERSRSVSPRMRSKEPIRKIEDKRSGPTRDRRSGERFRDRDNQHGDSESNAQNREDRDDRNRRGRYERGRGDDARRSHDRKPEPDKVRADDRSSPRGRERKSRFNEVDNKEYTWGKTEVKQEEKDKDEKEKPNFGLSGKLTADANTVNGIVIKYTEPDDAKQPKRRWRFYPFKGDKALPILYIHRQSCFLMGREKKVVDIHLEHPSVSKQHAALQFRATPFARADGSQGRRVRPYIIDLESANGTFVNNKKMDPRRYVELMERDVVKFGFSKREYVLLHENSKDDAQDDDESAAAAGAAEGGAGGAGGAAAVATTEQIKREKRAQQEIAEDGE